MGLYCGLNTTLVPMYISEISPINLRGSLGNYVFFSFILLVIFKKMKTAETSLLFNDVSTN